MLSDKMTTLEIRSVIGLSSILSLRMIGLFMVLPLFSLYAAQLPGSTPFLIGLGIGIYGLAQALLQIPFGMLSDRFGRKPIILLGLLLFILGSIIAAFSKDMTTLIIGRALQGMGAVGGTLLALIADLTRDEQRSKAMAIAGISIGFSFSVAIFVGPALTPWLKVNQLFLVAGAAGVAAIFILCMFIPTPQTLKHHADTEPNLSNLSYLITMPALLKLNIGIFILHAIFTATFVAIPLHITHVLQLSPAHQWWLYLPALLVACLFSLTCVGLAERQRRLKQYFLAAIAMIALAEGMFIFKTDFFATVIALTLFFSGFSLLEAFLPSLISRTAPVERKGSALGIYSCAQFFGIFVGGVAGGYAFGQFSFFGVYLFCMILSLLWLALACYMEPPRYLITRVLRFSSVTPDAWQAIAQKLHLIPGIVEVSIISEEGIAYLKMERSTAKHPDFIRFTEQLQSESI